MTKLYRKSEIWFAVSVIIVYVVGSSIAENVSEAIGVNKSVTLPFHIAMSVLILLWIKKNELLEKYGLCRSDAAPSRFLYYIPLVLLSMTNLMFGVRMNMPVIETVLYVASMICVGFLEEVIFRGFLFRAMEHGGIASAISVSSITFGIGHIVNLINGSGAGVIENVCQIASAVAFGFLFVTVFYRGGSILPCIISHSTINSLSAFANESAITSSVNIIMSVGLCAVVALYTLLLYKTIPLKDKN